jgi:predicted deacylase
MFLILVSTLGIVVSGNNAMTFTIGSISAKKGEKTHGYLDAAELPLGTVSLPVTLINGEKSGPTLFISSGIHATEYPGIRAAQILAQKLEPETIEGTIIVLHCANPQMFNAKTAFVNPADHINFNRIFPGTPQFTGFYGSGSISHHITNFIYTHLMQKASHFIDLHGGDLPELVPFFAASSKTGDDKKDVDTEAMLRYGGAGLLQTKDIMQHVDGVHNISRYLGLIDEKPVEPKEQRRMGGPSVGVRASRGGFFRYSVGPGDIVAMGQQIGEITDLFGQCLEEIKSPINGVVTIINFLSAKHTRDPLFSLKRLVD